MKNTKSPEEFFRNLNNKYARSLASSQSNHSRLGWFTSFIGPEKPIQWGIFNGLLGSLLGALISSLFPSGFGANWFLEATAFIVFMVVLPVLAAFITAKIVGYLMTVSEIVLTTVGATIGMLLFWMFLMRLVMEIQLRK